MSETTATALKFAAGIILAIVLVSIAIMVFTPAADSAKSVTTDFTANTTELQDQKYLVYDNTVVSGSQVITALRRFESQAKDEQIALYVQTGKNAAGQWYHAKFDTDKVGKTGASDISATTNVTHSEYINPAGMFAASVHRDSNGVIRAIKFVQEKQ
ncbi:ABC transporter permease [Lysinibacillus xylanilyticus]|uniref:ABC transporter permease n=1 Tax=Lysinibacillus xylanilyticus TaxID=582475 RepID=UPI002B2468EC|nr:ABC transporter permease [Lysinibacillus xylanilyticus]MEB2280152.1 ABC transporter permease [Lysinibacillus xylanilyticus]